MLITALSAMLLPLVGFLVIMGTSFSISRRAAAALACSTLLGAFLAFSVLLLYYSWHATATLTLPLYQWIQLPGLTVSFGLYLDALSLLMAMVISGVGFLIHVYAIGYMDHDADYARFFACLNFFVSAMLLLVLADNLLLLFIGWEGVGLASYLLIGFWYQRPAAAQAATKAFIVNRIGDLGLLLAILFTLHTFGTANIEAVNKAAPSLFTADDPSLITLLLLLFLGASAKSAQLPLHTWLPDAMEGPTPVSALIHAATMVTAGVYLVVRLNALFSLSPTVLTVIAVVGATTSLYAALCACGQVDLKRVLAYSTLSQLGLMFLACGVGAFYAAMFHLTMHAFIKALLFLAAGNVVHMTHGTTLMAKMGGLAQKLPRTRWLFLIGVLALSAIPPLAAFFSKDLIMEQVLHGGHQALFGIGLAVTVLTPFYLMRAYGLTFKGAPLHHDKDVLAAREAPRVMLAPVALLAFFSIGGGLLGYGFGHAAPLQRLLEQANIVDHSAVSLLSLGTLLSVASALTGLAAAALLYPQAAQYLDVHLRLLRRSFYIDELYGLLIVAPLKALARCIVAFLEPKVFEGSIHFTATATKYSASLLQRAQSGQLRSYVAWMTLGAVGLIGYMLRLWNTLL